MTTINNANVTHTAAMPPQMDAAQEGSLETGVIGKAPAAVTPKATTRMLAMAEKAIAADSAGRPDNNKPVLAAPAATADGGTDITAMVNDFIERLADPAFAAKAEAFFTDLRKDVMNVMAAVNKKDGFDINGMTSFSPVELIMVLLHLLDKLRGNDAQLNSKMTLSAAASVASTAASLEQQGHDQMVGAVVGAALGMGLSAASIGMKVNGGRKNYLNEKNNGKAIKDLKTETQNAKNALNAAKPGAPGTEMTTLNGTAAGAPKTAEVAGSNKVLSDADRKLFEKQIAGHDDKLAEYEIAHTKNSFDAAKWTSAGDAAGALGTAANGFSTAAAHTQVMSERSQQTLSENASTVAKQASNEAAERNQAQNGDTRAIRDIAQQILNAITQGRGGQINNIRV